MDKKIRRIYKRAMDYYEKGQITKALELCELSLADNLGDSQMLNFKGLLLYQKGELKEAITVWKINFDLNNDLIAESYVKDAEADEERLMIYKKGKKALENLNVEEAINLFMKCTKSDFNSIKVNSAIALCYMKKGDYYRAKEYVDKVLKVDKNAVTALSIKKELDSMDLYYGEMQVNKSKIIIITFFVAIVATITVGYLTCVKSNEAKGINATEDLNSVEDKKQLNNDITENVQANEKINEDKAFNTNKILNLIENNDFDGLYKEMSSIRKEDVKSEDKEVYDQAITLIKNQGVAKFYEYGLWYFNNENYKDARNQLEMAYSYCEGNDLKQHIIFYIGSTTSEQGENDTALKFYEEYYKLYPTGSYVEGVLYELALLTASKDKEKGRVYANKLIDNYPNSIYINEKLLNIINN